MLASVASAAIAAFFLFPLATARDVCSSAPYASLTCLSSISQAANACSALPTQTTNLTVTTTILDVTTVATTQKATEQVTINITSTEVVDTTITSGATTTITIDKFNSTKTTRCIETTYTAATHPVCKDTDALSALASITSNNTLATLCSCIGHAASTVTETQTVEAPPVRTTVYDVHGNAAKTTQYFLTNNVKTTTKRPVAYVTSTGVKTKTVTRTTSLAAPTFTHVFGPKAGCANTQARIRKQLKPSVTCLDEASKECKAICEQEPTCDFVWVQEMIGHSTSEKTYFQCAMNDRHLVKHRDIQCGKNKFGFGEAKGFNACGRGVD